MREAGERLVLFARKWPPDLILTGLPRVANPEVMSEVLEKVTF
jgi:hypothetical protein